MSSTLKWIISFILFFIFGWFYIYVFEKPHEKIEAKVQYQANENLKAKGLGHLKAVADGMDLTLSGNASSEEQRVQAVEACKVCGNNPVDDSALKLGSIDKYNVVATHSKSPKKITLSGIVPNEDVKNEILSQANSLYGEGNVTNRLVADNFQSEETEIFKDLVKSAIGPLDNFDGDSSFNLNFNRTNYSGKYFDDQLDDRARSNLNGIASNHEVQFPEHAIEVVVTTTTTEPVAKVNCQKKINDLLRGEKILFKTSSARINSQSNILLQNLAAALAECPAYGVEVGGHTDKRGKAAFNLNLSKQRASSVKAKLINLGVSNTRVRAVGYGETRPLADGNSASDYAQNRRIEIKLQGEL